MDPGFGRSDHQILLRINKHRVEKRSRLGRWPASVAILHAIAAGRVKDLGIGDRQAGQASPAG